MDIKPFIVTHDEKFCRMEGERCATDDQYAEDWQGETNFRYLIWAESPLDAARGVQARKKELGRMLPDKYKVFKLRTGPHWEIHNLGDGDQPEDDEVDLDMFEGMFGQSVEVEL